MIVPSGKIFNEGDIRLLRYMAHYGFVRWSDAPFTLRSKVKSHVYVFGREDLTDNPNLEVSVGWKIFQIVNKDDSSDRRQSCLIGIPTAGTVLAQAAAMVSYYKTREHPICHRIMREVKKTYGAHQTWVNGKPDVERHRYWMVDNVATDGQSKIEAAKKLEEDGYPAKEMPCLIFVDRQQGAVARLKREGFEHVVVAYNLLDITYAFGQLNRWPEEAVKRVEEEIHAHQFLAQ